MKFLLELAAIAVLACVWIWAFVAMFEAAAMMLKAMS
jgi:hypothetical protein